MGLFDSLMIKCPNCGYEVEFQSKVGDCILDSYTLENVPNIIKLDLINKIRKCDNCGMDIKIGGKIK